MVILLLYSTEILAQVPKETSKFFTIAMLVVAKKLYLSVYHWRNG